MCGLFQPSRRSTETRHQTPNSSRAHSHPRNSNVRAPAVENHRVPLPTTIPTTATAVDQPSARVNEGTPQPHLSHPPLRSMSVHPSHLPQTTYHVPPSQTPLSVHSEPSNGPISPHYRSLHKVHSRQKSDGDYYASHAPNAPAPEVSSQMHPQAPNTPGSFHAQANSSRPVGPSTLKAPSRIAHHDCLHSLQVLTDFFSSVVSTDPGSFTWTQKIIEVLSHLIKTRPHDIEPFTRLCFDVYRERFSRTQRNMRHNSSARREPSTVLNSPHCSQFQPQASKYVADTDSKQQLEVAHSDPNASQQCSLPVNATSNFHSIDNELAKPKPCLEKRTSEQAAPPLANAVASNSNILCEPPGENPLKKQTKCEERTLFGEKKKMIQYRSGDLLLRRELEGLLLKRFTVFDKECEALPFLTRDKKSYVIWNPALESLGKEVILSSTKAHVAQSLLDDAQRGDCSQLLSIYVNALRFLWAYLVAERSARSGAIFYHGIGYPKTQLLFVFARLYYETFENDTSKRLLVISNTSSVGAWVKSGTGLCPTRAFHVGMLSKDLWYEEVMEWKLKGGVLLCTPEDILMVHQASGPLRTKRADVLRELIRPGPDIVVVDEASQMCTWDVLALGIISSIQTTARLALTSVPFGGNMTLWYTMVEWACPRLLGTQIDFFCRYLRPISDGHFSRASNEHRKHALFISSQLWCKVRSVTYLLDAESRRDALLKRGKNLLEISVSLNLSEEEAKIYSAASEFLKDSSRRDEISRFIAFKILSALLFGVPAALKLIREINIVRQILTKESETPDISSKHSNKRCHKATIFRLFSGMKEKILKADDCLQQLSERINKMVTSRIEERSKLRVLGTIVSVFVKEQDRTVIFVSCDEARVEIYHFLKLFIKENMPSTDPSIFTIDMNEPSSDWQDSLMSFNLSTCGAILLAPYGVSQDCMEDNRWAFVNATKTIFADRCWASSALVQAFQRVQNFAWFCPPEVAVVYLTVYGTVDSLMEETMNHFMQERREQCLRYGLPYCVLTDPELPSRILSYKSEASLIGKGVPMIEREGIDYGWYHEMTQQILKLNTGGSWFTLKKVEQVKDGLYSQLESLGGSPATDKVIHGWKVLNCNDDSVLPLVKRRLAALPRVIRHEFRRTIFLNRVQDAIKDEHDLNDLGGDGPMNNVLMTWRRYHALYEGGGFDSVKLSGAMLPTEGRKDGEYYGHGDRGFSQPERIKDHRAAVDLVGNEHEFNVSGDNYDNFEERSRDGIVERSLFPQRRSEGGPNSRDNEERRLDDSRGSFDDGKRGLKRRRSSYPIGNGRDNICPSLQYRGRPGSPSHRDRGRGSVNPLWQRDVGGPQNNFRGSPGPEPSSPPLRYHEFSPRPNRSRSPIPPYTPSSSGPRWNR